MPNTSKRRSNGEGGARQRADGRWEATVELPARDGKRRRKWIYASTKGEALKQAREFTRRLETMGGAEPPDAMTVAALAAEFLQAKEGTVSASTWAHYEGTLRRYIVPQLGGQRVVRLQATHVDAMHRSLTSQGLSARTCHHAHAVLTDMLNLAIRRDYLARNVALVTKAPAIPREHPDYFTLGEVRRLLDAAASSPLEALFVLAVTMGMRQGEILALHWEDVDLDSARLTVTRTLTQGPGRKLAYGPPKTAQSMRTIGLPSQAVEALQRHAARSATDGEPPTGVVFASARGTFINPPNLVNRHFKPLLENAGLRSTNFHMLRHTYATNAVAGGVPIHAVSKLLGHSDVATTMRYYAHATPQLLADAVDQFSALLAAS